MVVLRVAVLATMQQAVTEVLRYLEVLVEVLVESNDFRLERPTMAAMVALAAQLLVVEAVQALLRQAQTAQTEQTKFQVV